MKIYLFTVIALLPILACNACHADKTNASALSGDSLEVESANWNRPFETKKQELLSIPAERKVLFYYSSDTVLRNEDPHAYWLMDCIVQMYQPVNHADECWSWMLAVNDMIGEYYNRTGILADSSEPALTAVKHLIGIYFDGNQAEMNTASYVSAVVAAYSVVNAYGQLVDRIMDSVPDKEESAELRDLYYQEFSNWYQLNASQSLLMDAYTYALAHYSSSPLNINGQYRTWSEGRLKALNAEQALLFGGNERFEYHAKEIEPESFSALLAYYRSRTPQTVIEEYLEDWDEEEKDYEYARDRTEGYIDFDQISEILACYEDALTEWREIRRRISVHVSKNRQKDYDRLTTCLDMQFYYDLQSLKELRY